MKIAKKKNKGTGAAGRKVGVPNATSSEPDPAGPGSTPGTTKMPAAKKPPSPPQPTARMSRAR
jgi:hypothetical protein